MARKKILPPASAPAAVLDSRPSAASLEADGWERSHPEDRDGFVKHLGDDEFLFYNVRSCVVSLRSPQSSIEAPDGKVTVVGFGSYGKRKTVRSLRAFVEAIAACDK